MSFITKQDLKQLLSSANGGPCVSLYMRTFVTFPDSDQNPILFKGLLKKLEADLSKHMAGRDFKPILEAFEKYQTDDEFWRNRTASLAMFYREGKLMVFDMPRPTPTDVYVADSFHLKPVFRILQTTDRYHVLTLDRNLAQLFEANRDTIVPIQRDDLPTNPQEHDLGARTRVGEQRFSDFGRSVMSFHDVDEKAQDADFFNEIDKFVEKHISRRFHLPLVLVALPEHQGTFRKVASNPMLVDEGVAIGTTGLKAQDLREKTFAIIEKIQHAFIQKTLDEVQEAQAHGKGSTDVQDIAKAAVAGRVAKLLVDADKLLPGKINQQGEIQFENLSDLDVDDILDDLMEIVFQTDGEIHALPSALMPLDSGVAAVYRY